MVAIIRGGGSQTDLSWFDNYMIAYHITQFPIPVITGIGHEKDLSVADLVAWRSEKTPTAVADFIVGSVASFEENIMAMASEIISYSQDIIETGKKAIDTARLRLIPLARVMITSQRSGLSEMIRGIRSGIRNTFRVNESLIENMAGSVSLLDPQKVLGRGYTITSVNGRIVKSGSMLEDDDIIETRFVDGSVKSKILKTAEND
jgi:exodeoxyribonuclease VII large subunit